MTLLAPPARVRAYYGYRNATRLVLTGRALRPRRETWERRSTLAKVHALLRQFASREVPDLAVTLEIRIDGREPVVAIGRSDGEGYVHFDVPLDPPWPLPEEPVWETVALRWVARDGPQAIDAHVLAPGRGHRVAVISDIDDTIVETGAGNLGRNWRRVLAQMPAERTPVPGAAALYTELGGGHVGERRPATRRPFFYVSSSPWNLFDYLVAFQTAHGLPHGPLLLRDWSLSTLRGGGHGAHKTAAIGSLVTFYPDTRFALIGDSTQADAVAFAAAVAAHPGRIAGVFLRVAPDAPVDVEEGAALAAIEAAGVPLWRGESFEVGAEFLAAIGVSPAGETAQIVHTIEATGLAPTPAKG